MKQKLALVSFGLAVLCTQAQLLIPGSPTWCAWAGLLASVGMMLTWPTGVRRPLLGLGSWVVFGVAASTAIVVAALNLSASLPVADSFARLALVVWAFAPVVHAACIVHDAQPQPQSVFARVTPMPWGSDVILSIGDEGEHGVQVVGPRERLEAVARLLSEGVAS